MTPLLQIDNLFASYGNVQALHGISLTIPNNGVAALLGANGAGKTTTLRAICGMVRRTGSIRFMGEEISKRNTTAIARMGIAHVPDGRGTFHGLTTEENLQCGAMSRGNRAEIARDIEETYQWFPRLKERQHQQAGTLSGGEQQMLAIARALMLRPKLMLLDEPSFGLAPMISAEVFELLRRINSERGVGMLVVEQNANLALSLATTAYLIETGNVVRGGPADAIKNDQSIRSVYLGY